VKLTEVGRLVHALMTLLAKKFILTLQKCHQLSVVKLWGNAGERRSPSAFGGGTPFP